jgi:hypothetical protein
MYCTVAPLLTLVNENTHSAIALDSIPLSFHTWKSERRQENLCFIKWLKPKSNLSVKSMYYHVDEKEAFLSITKILPSR